MLLSELRMLLRKKITLLGIAAMLVAGVGGAFNLSGASPQTFQSMNLTSTLSAMGAARIAAIVGVLAVALTALLWLSQDKRKRAETLVDSAANLRKVTLSRIGALLLWAVALCVIACLGILAAWTFAGLAWDVPALLISVCAVTLPAMLTALFASCGIYLLTDSVDAGFLGIAALFFVSVFSQDYRLNWVTGHVEWFSDFAGFDMRVPSLLYGRLVGLLGALALCLLGLLAARHHGMGFSGSVRRQRSRAALAACALVLAAACAGAYIFEPFVDEHSPLLRQAELSNYGNDEITASETVYGDARVLAVNSAVTIDARAGTLRGSAEYTLEGAPGDRELEFSVNGGLAPEGVLVGGRPAPGTLSEGKLRLSLPAGETEVEIRYGGHVQNPGTGSQAGFIGAKSVYLQEGSCWLPVIERRAYGKTRITGSVTAPSNLIFATPGKEAGRETVGGLTTYAYALEADGLDMALYGGEYEVIAFDAGGAQVELYVSPRHIAAVTANGLQERAREIAAFYAERIGPYPFDAPMKIVETSLYKPGGHSSLNLVTAAEAYFNMRAMNPQNPGGYPEFAYLSALELLAHEMAHQWWGSGAQVAYAPPWSSEGLASYMSYAYMESAFSKMEADSMGLYAWANSVTAKRDSYYAQPGSMEKLSGAMRNQVIMEALQVSLYQEMPLRLHAVRQEAGDEAFWRGIAAVYAARGEGERSYEELLAQVGLREEDISLDEVMEGLYETYGL